MWYTYTTYGINGLTTAPELCSRGVFAKHYYEKGGVYNAIGVLMCI